MGRLLGISAVLLIGGVPARGLSAEGPLDDLGRSSSCVSEDHVTMLQVAAAEKVRADEDTSKAEGAAMAAHDEDGGRPGGRVATYLKNADANQDGFLTKDEFPALLDNPEVEHLLARSKDENLKTDDAGDLFALADRDSDGRVSLQELIADAKKIGMDNAEQASMLQVSIHERAVRASPLAQEQGQEIDFALVQGAQNRALDSSLLGKDQDCEMHGWGSWSACSTSCDYGKQSRSRGIKQQKEGNGRSCGSTSEERSCKLVDCPIHCTLSDWTGWSACSATCGDGTKTRSRSVTVDAQHGGSPCEGSLEASENCRDKECPIHCKLSDWTAWSACSTTCGQGTRSRSRSVRVGAKHGGQACEDALEASEDCKDRECPVHCILSGWSDWAACSDSCGAGTRSRSRTVTTPAQHGGVACDEAERVLEVVLGPQAP